MKLVSRASSVAFGVALLFQGQTMAGAVETQEVPIVDPVFAMTAYTLVAPAGWHAEGTVLPPASCDPSTPVVFKATSPDRSAGRYRLPTVSWTWGGGARPKPDCNLARQAISAADFLTFYARSSKVGFVKTVDIPDSQRLYPQHPDQTIDQAAMLARYTEGEKKTEMEELIQDTVICSTFTSVGIGESHVCNATVVRSYAPLGKLTDLMPTFRSFKVGGRQGKRTATSAIAEASEPPRLRTADREGRLLGSDRRKDGL